MRRLFILLAFLLIIPIVTAQTVNFISNQVAPGEILQVEISQEKLSPSDIRLLNPYGYPTTFGINFIVLDENYYFIYTTVSEKSLAGQYNLKIKNQDFKFQVIEKEDYSTFSPMFIKYEDGEKYYKIKLTNHGSQETTYSIESSYEGVNPSVSSLIIPPKSTKYFYIHIDPEKIKKSIIASVSMNDYLIPIYIVKDVFPTQVFTKEKTISKDSLIFYIKKDSTETQINYIKNTLTEQKPLEGELFIKNNLNTTLENINLNLTGNLNEIVELNKYTIDKLEPDESIKLEITVDAEKLDKKIYEGSLLVDSTELPMSFEIEETIEPIEEKKKPEPLITEEVIEEIPEEEPGKKSYGKYFAYLIIILLAAVLYYYYFGKKEHKKSIKFSSYLKSIGKST